MSFNSINLAIKIQFQQNYKKGNVNSEIFELLPSLKSEWIFIKEKKCSCHSLTSKTKSDKGQFNLGLYPFRYCWLMDKSLVTLLKHG